MIYPSIQMAAKLDLCEQATLAWRCSIIIAYAAFSVSTGKNSSLTKRCGNEARYAPFNCPCLPDAFVGSAMLFVDTQVTSSVEPSTQRHNHPGGNVMAGNAKPGSEWSSKMLNCFWDSTSMGSVELLAHVSEANSDRLSWSPYIPDAMNLFNGARPNISRVNAATSRSK